MDSVAEKATSVIPIVFPVATDPVGTGLVASLARPGGNVTGLSVQSAYTAAKRFEIFREFVPEMRRLGLMANAGNSANLLEINEVEGVVRKLGLEVQLEKVMVPHWVRGEETAALTDYPSKAPNTTQKIVLTALGGSVATPTPTRPPRCGTG